MKGYEVKEYSFPATNKSVRILNSMVSLEYVLDVERECLNNFHYKICKKFVNILVHKFKTIEKNRLRFNMVYV